MCEFVVGHGDIRALPRGGKAVFSTVITAGNCQMLQKNVATFRLIKSHINVVIVCGEAINRSGFLYAFLPPLFVVNWSNCEVSFMAALAERSWEKKRSKPFALSINLHGGKFRLQLAVMLNTLTVPELHTWDDYCDSDSVGSALRMELSIIGCVYIQVNRWWALLFDTVHF